MNLRQGLFRAWAVFSIAWVVFWLLDDRPPCAWGDVLTGGAIRCYDIGPTGLSNPLGLVPYVSDVHSTVFIPLTTLISGPAISGALILAGLWILNGLKQRTIANWDATKRFRTDAGEPAY